jgi:Mrp family chromosome partitioning ATPase
MSRLQDQEVLQEAIRDVQLAAGLEKLRVRDEASRDLVWLEEFIDAGGQEPVDVPTDRGITIGITSPNARTGKTTLATALAAALAHDAGPNVSLVDADYRTPAIGRDFDIAAIPGLTDYLAGALPLEQVSHTVADETHGVAFQVVPFGTRSPDVVGQMRLADSARLVRELSGANRYTVFDLPSTLPTTAAAMLGGLCDAVILVVRSGKTTHLETERSLEKLSDCRVAGIVVNDWRTRIPRWVEHVLNLSR